MKDQQKLPPLSAVLWILISTLLVSGTAFMGWLYYLHVRHLRTQDEKYHIAAIIQKSSQKETLKTSYLAQLLDLSVDRPISLYTFNLEEGEKKLKKSPVIKKAKIKKISPDTLFIDYQTYIAIGYLEGQSNIAIDKEGYLFPFREFFSAKPLPYFYFSQACDELKWGNSLKNNKEFQLALAVLKKLKKVISANYLIKAIDLSLAFSHNYGKRQIIVTLLEKKRKTEQKHLVYLRLNSDNYLQNLDNYVTLQLHEAKQKKQSYLIDFRIDQLASVYYSQES